MTTSPTALFVGVDRAVFLAAFVDRLRSAGVSVPLGSIERAAASLAAAGPISRTDLYWLLRICMVSRRDDLVLFDRLFDAVFDFELNRSVKQQPREQGATQTTGDEHASVRMPDLGDDAVEGGGLPWTTRPAIVETEGEDEDDESDDLTLPELLPSALRHLADTPFDLLDETQLAEMTRTLEVAAGDWPRRSSRRRRRHHRQGRPQLRSTLRRSLRTGGEPLQLTFERERTRDRPVVLLVDVSGSMESFARPYLHVTRTMVSGGKAEVFAFSTELTRLTAALKHRSPVEAINRASEEVGDRFSGTRLASTVNALLRHRVWGSTVRGAVVVVISDGWDTEAPDDLGRAMAKLHRLSHRVVWVNPRVAAPGFEPLVGSMAAALPYCDHFLSGHSIRAMDDVLAAITGVAPGARRREHTPHV